MHWQYNPYAIVVFISAIIAIGLTVLGWQRRTVPGATWFTLLMLSAGIWSVGYSLELVSADLPSIIFWAKAQYLGIVFIPIAWLGLISVYTTQHGRQEHRKLAALFLLIIPLITVALNWTNEYHELIWANVKLVTNNNIARMDFTPGPGYWSFVAYSYIIMLYTLYLLIEAFARSTAIYRKQITFLFGFFIIIWSGNASYIFGLMPNDINLTPVAYSIGSLVIAWGLFRYQLLDIAPIAREAVIKGMQDAVIALNTQDYIVELNPAAQKIIGQSASEAIGQPLAQAFAVYPKLVEQCQNKAEARAEIIVGAEGEKRFFDLTASPLYDQRGHLTGRLVTLHDVTKRVQAEKELQQAYDELELRVDELSTLNLIIQTMGTVSNLQDALQIVAGTITRLFSAQSSLIALFHAEQAEAIISAEFNRRSDIPGAVGLKFPIKDNLLAQQILQTKQPALLSNAQKHPLLTHFHHMLQQRKTQSMMIVPLLSRGEVVGAMGIERDDTGQEFTPAELRLSETIAGQIAGGIENARLFDEMKQAKENAEEAQRTAEIANRAKSAFLANMSHELRTPLNAIIGFSQLMLRNQELPAESQRNLDIINRSGEHLLTLINDILDMSKVEAGRAALNKLDFDLHRLLDELEDMFYLKAKEKKLQLSFERAPNVPRYIRTDMVKLRQILINLLGNAVKFTKEGSVTLRVKMKDEGGRVKKEQEIHPSSFILQISVEDTGPGISPDELDTLFDPFSQAKTHLTQEGTGLGLSISQRFVQLMGGNINVISPAPSTNGKKGGPGALFEFNIYYDPMEEIPERSAKATPQIIGLAANQPDYRILIADDVGDNRKLLVNLLEPLGFKVKEAVNGREAVEVWAAWRPHLIWMDMRMPVMDGYEATRQIKNKDEGGGMKDEISGNNSPFIPPSSSFETVVIALTASAMEDQKINSLAAGCDDFLAKPFQEADVFQMMSKHLGVQYIYANAASKLPPLAFGKPPQTAIIPNEATVTSQLTNLSSDWLDALDFAASTADADRCLELLKQIEPDRPALTKSLIALINDFQFETLVALIEKVRNRK